MEFTINRDAFLKSISHAYGIIEKKTTLPILANILIEAKNSKIKITATDLDIIYSEEISDQNLSKEGSTTTSATVLYDILRKSLARIVRHQGYSHQPASVPKYSDHRLEYGPRKYQIVLMLPQNQN